jgi:polyphosphate kinase 2
MLKGPYSLSPLSDRENQLISAAVPDNHSGAKSKVVFMAKKKTKKNGNGNNDDNKNGLNKKDYEKELYRLQSELVKLQYWVKETGYKAIVVFEGRDAAGKGGVIKRMTERVSPRVFRVVALPTPTEREKTQWYAQRYISHFPAGGEIVLFDRSWYNRLGVERVMEFCTERECQHFAQYAPIFERSITDAGIKLIKYWFDVSMEEQERRFQSRIDDPRKSWKLSPMDVESYKRWYAYSRARDEMLAATHTDHAPWHVVRADDKMRARLNCITHLLGQIPYRELPRDSISLGKRDKENAYDDKAYIREFGHIPERF